MQTFEIPAGLLKTGINGLIVTTKRNLANQRKTMLPAIIAAVQNDIAHLERFAAELESIPFDDLLVVSTKAKIVEKTK